MWTVYLTNKAEEHLEILSKDKTKYNKVKRMLSELKVTPFTGIGKPEKLKYLKNGYSRRIDRKNRLIYEVSSDNVLVVSLLGHYE